VTRRDPSRFLAHLWALEDALVQAGLEPMPEWWRRSISNFYRSGRRRFVVRKGRRVFASTCVAPRLAVAEMLWGEHHHTPGSPPLEYVFLSTKRDEAANRLLGVKAILEIVGVPHNPVGQTIELKNRPAIFKVVTVRHNTAVGGTVAFAWLDEVARWNDNKTGKNPADLVVSTFAPALSTLPDAKMFLISSPFSVNDFHARQFERGDTADQYTAFGNTWTINPTLTEEQTHELEPDEEAWLREYAAVPSATVQDNWFGDAIERAIFDGPMLPIPQGVRPIIALDPAFDPKTADLFGWAVVTSEPGQLVGERANRITMVRACGGWEPFEHDPAADPSDPLQGPVYRMMRRVREELCDRFIAGVDDRKRAYSDQFEGYSLTEIAALAGINLDVQPWTGGMGEGSKLAKFKDVRTGMYNGTFRIPRDESLLSDFRSVKGILTAAGVERIEMPRTERGHCDILSAAVLGGAVCMARTPTPADDLTPRAEQQLWREAEVKKIIEKRKKERQSPMAQREMMRRAWR